MITESNWKLKYWLIEIIMEFSLQIIYLKGIEMKEGISSGKI